jgi:hypothetical protein
VEAGGYPASTTDRVNTKIRMRELEFFYVNQPSLKSIDLHEKHICAIISLRCSLKGGTPMPNADLLPSLLSKIIEN